MSIVEPILQENKDRFVIFPIKHQDIWEWYKKQEACIWTAEEIDLHQDLNDWNNKLNEDEKYFIKHLQWVYNKCRRNCQGNFVSDFVADYFNCNRKENDEETNKESRSKRRLI